MNKKEYEIKLTYTVKATYDIEGTDVEEMVQKAKKHFADLTIDTKASVYEVKTKYSKIKPVYILDEITVDSVKKLD